MLRMMKNKEGIKTKSRIYGYEKKKSKRKKLMNKLIKRKHDIVNKNMPKDY